MAKAKKEPATLKTPKTKVERYEDTLRVVQHELFKEAAIDTDDVRCQDDKFDTNEGDE